MADEEDYLDEEDDPVSIRLQRLMDRKEDLLSNLESVDVSLAKLGYKVETKATQEMKKQLLTGIRINNKLSFRGEEMARLYFDYLDEDKDGYLKWEDFRAMRTIEADFVGEMFGMLHEPEYSNFESWCMFMKDLGIKSDRYGRVNLKEFIKYRRLVEMRRPLAKELGIVKLGYLPPTLSLWSKLKTIVKERLEDLSEAKRANVIERGFTFDDIHYLLSNVGITYTYPEYLENMLARASLENLHESLQNKFMKARYAQANSTYSDALAKGAIPQHTIKLEIDHMKYTKIQKLLSWLFADRPLPKNQNGLYHDLIRFKYMMYRKIRYTERLSKWLFAVGYQMRLRRVFDDFKPISKMSSKETMKTDLDLSVTVTGQDGNLDGGMGLECSSQKVDHPEQFLMNHKLPREAGFACIIELMLKPDVSPDVAETTAHHLLSWIKNHFDGEFKKNVLFRGIFCFPAHSEGDGALVMRIALCWKRAVSLDAWMEQMLLPYILNDIVTAIQGSIKTNQAFTDIFNSTSNFQLDTLLSAQLELSLKYRPIVIETILRRIRLSLASSVTLHQTRPDSEDANEIMRRQLRVYYPQIIAFCNYVESIIAGQRANQVKFEFKNLSELLGKIGFANTWFKKWFPESLGSVQGYVTRLYNSWCDYFVSEYHKIFDPLAKRLEDQVKDEEENREFERFKLLHLGMGLGADKKDNSNKKVDKAANVMDKLKMLGIEMEEDDVMAEDAHDPRSLINLAINRLVKNDMAALTTMENAKETITGLHSIQLLCGKFKIAINAQAMDFVEAIPKIPSIQAVKKKVEAEKEALRAKSDEAMKVERKRRMAEREKSEHDKVLAEQMKAK
jgi:hypothetical protein